MPVAIAGAALSGAIAAASGATVLGLTGASLGFAVFAANVALAGLQMVLAPKPKTPDFGSFSSAASERGFTINQAITTHRLIIGEARVGGALIYIGQTENKKYLHYMVVLAAHEITAIGTVFFDNYPVFVDDLDGDGNVTVGKFANKIRIKKLLGARDQVADPDLVSESDEWTSDHRARGRACLYLRFEDNSSTFPGDIPNPSAMVKGAKLFDTRTDATEWSQNPSLAVRWFQATEYGYLTPDAGFEDTYTNAAANVCDEFASTLAVDYDIDAMSVADDALDLVADEDDILKYRTGDRVQVSSTGVVPGGLAVLTNYYVIILREKARDDKTLRIQLATSYANANAATAISITDVGSGTITVSKNGEPRYTANGVINTEQDPKVSIQELLSAMGGLAVRSISGQWRFQAAAYTAPTVTYDVDDLRAGIKPRTKVSSRARYNAVHGIYVSPLNNWQPQDYPAVTSDEYEEADAKYRDAFTVDIATDVATLAGDGGFIKTGDKVRCKTTDTLPDPLVTATTYYAIAVTSDTIKFAATFDNALAGTAIDITDIGTGTHKVARLDQIREPLDLPFTDRSNTSQRLGAIKLRKNRLEITVAPVKLRLSGFLEQAGGTVAFDYDRFGWSGKPFEIATFKAVVENDAEGNPLIGTEMTWREIASTAYDYNPATDEVAVEQAPSTSLGSALDVAAPTLLVLTSGTTVLDTRLDGTIFSRLKLSWTAPADQFVTSGGFIEIEYKKSSESDWIDAPDLRGATTEVFILDVVDTVAYDARIRSRNSAGVPSDWVTVSNHVVAGKSAPASNVSGFSAQQTSAGTVTFGWNKITDADRNGYTIKRHARTTPTAWADMTLVTEEERGTEKTSASVPPGDWTFAIKAVDTSGNESTAETTSDLVVVNVFDVVEQQTNAPRWPGAVTGMIKHGVSGKLIPRSTVTMDSTTNLGKLSADNLVADMYYEGAVEDLGFDADDVRIWADITAAQAPEITTSPTSRFEVDYRDDADAFDGFEAWTIGNASFRHIKGRAVSERGALLENFDMVCDVPEHTSVHKGVNIDASTGSTVTFTRTFHDAAKIGIDVSAQGTSARIVNYSSLTTTSVHVDVFDKDGSNVGGTVDLTATGP